MLNWGHAFWSWERQPLADRSGAPAEGTEAPDQGSDGIVSALTERLAHTIVRCNPEVQLQQLVCKPQRRLTSPAALPDQQDNEEGELVMYVGDELGEEGSPTRYRVLEALGKGTFGQVMLCSVEGRKVAVKVIKNRPAYAKQALVEVGILRWVNETVDPLDQHHIVRMIDSFCTRDHLCIAFELLSISMLELLQQNGWRGVSTNLIRVFMCQLVDALVVLSDAQLIHCDLKPENILLVNTQHNSWMIKLADFGSACYAGRTVYTYIQSRFYRAPEVVLGLPYTSLIDIWSLGCIAMELLLGLPLYAASSAATKQQTELLTEEEYGVQHRFEPGRHHFGKDSSLHDLVLGAPPTPKHSATGQSILPEQLSPDEMQVRAAMEHFVSAMVVVDIENRWTARQIATHPFLTRAEFDGFFFPDPDPTHPCVTQPPPPVVSTAPMDIPSMQIQLPDQFAGSWGSYTHQGSWWLTGYNLYDYPASASSPYSGLHWPQNELQFPEPLESPRQAIPTSIARVRSKKKSHHRRTSSLDGFLTDMPIPTSELKQAKAKKASKPKKNKQQRHRRRWSQSSRDSSDGSRDEFNFSSSLPQETSHAQNSWGNETSQTSNAEAGQSKPRSGRRHRRLRSGDLPDMSSLIPPGTAGELCRASSWPPGSGSEAEAQPKPAESKNSNSKKKTRSRRRNRSSGLTEMNIADMLGESSLAKSDHAASATSESDGSSVL